MKISEKWYKSILKLEWFNCLLPLQQNMSPLVGCPRPGGFLLGERERERKLKLSGGLMPVPPKFNVYTHCLGFLCLASERDGQKNKEKKRQTRPPSSVGSRPPLPKFSGYEEVEAHYILHRSTIWVRLMCTELGPKTSPKSRFCHEANEYMSPLICRLSGDIIRDVPDFSSGKSEI